MNDWFDGATVMVAIQLSEKFVKSGLTRQNVVLSRPVAVVSSAVAVS